MNALVMYDRETDTLWSQFLSRGVKGPLAGTPLEILPSMQTNWQTWSELYPNTLVLDKNGRYFSDDYENYYRSPAAGASGNPTPTTGCPRRTSSSAWSRETRSGHTPSESFLWRRWSTTTSQGATW